MKQSGFLARQKAERQELLNAGMRIEKQFMLDTLQMSLHQLGWGYKRIKELTDLWGEIYNDYHIALEGKNESDVWQERMDAQIRDIIKFHQLKLSASFTISAAISEHNAPQNTGDFALFQLLLLSIIYSSILILQALGSTEPIVRRYKPVVRSCLPQCPLTLCLRSCDSCILASPLLH